MKSTITILLLIFLLSSESIADKILAAKNAAETSQSVKSGMAMTLSQKFFDAYREQAIDSFEESMMNLKLQDSNPSFGLGITKALLHLTNQNMASFSIDKNDSYITLNKESPHIVFKVANISLDLDFDYTIETQPDWGNDQGTGQINIRRMHIQVNIVPFNKRGKLQLDFNDVIVGIEDFNVTFKGVDEEFSEGLTLIFDAFNDFFKKEFANIMARKMSKTLEKTLNYVLYRGPELYPIYSDQIYLNYTLTMDPIFTDKFMTIPFDGTFISSSQPANQLSIIEKGIPQYQEKAKQIQFYISEQSLQSALQSYHYEQLLQLDQDDISADSIDMLFYTFKNVYGENQAAKISIDTVDPAPQLTIKPKLTQIKSCVNIRIKNPFNNLYDSVIIKTNMSIDVQLNISQNFNLTGSVKNISFEVEDVKIFFQAEETVEDVQERIELLNDPFRAKINRILRKGIKLPLPELLIVDLKQSDLVSYNGYIMIEADPIVKNENIYRHMMKQ